MDNLDKMIVLTIDYDNGFTYWLNVTDMKIEKENLSGVVVKEQVIKFPATIVDINRIVGELKK